MKEDGRASSIIDREKQNEQVTDDVANGKQQFQFFAETNPEVKDKLAWFNSTVKDWDMQSVDLHSSMNRLEHGDAFALQRDVNYAYCDRKRLMEIGHDGRYESAYQAQFKSKIVKESGNR